MYNTAVISQTLGGDISSVLKIRALLNFAVTLFINILTTELEVVISTDEQFLNTGGFR